MLVIGNKINVIAATINATINIKSDQFAQIVCNEMCDFPGTDSLKVFAMRCVMFPAQRLKVMYIYASKHWG